MGTIFAAVVADWNARLSKVYVVVHFQSVLRFDPFHGTGNTIWLFEPWRLPVVLAIGNARPVSLGQDLVGGFDRSALLQSSTASLISDVVVQAITALVVFFSLIFVSFSRWLRTLRLLSSIATVGKSRDLFVI